jgi:hypothetical protein
MIDDFHRNATEVRLGLAERIWEARIKACGASAVAEEEPLRLIMEKLVREEVSKWFCAGTRVN